MSLSKHIANSPKTLVLDSLQGVVFQNPALEIQGTTVFVKDVAPRVHLISGGGSGHEPHVSAMCGEGGLSGAICGQVFASPNANQVSEALIKLKSGTGTLIIVKRYTGDLLNFGLAAEKYAAENAGKEVVKMIVVGEDVAVPKSQGALTGRRGLAGTVLVYKVAGHLATTGASLNEVEFIASLVSNSIGTIGMGLDHCHVFGTTASTESYLKEDEAELGMGIHNEPGIKKISPIPSAGSLTNTMLDMITNTSDPERSFLPFKNDGKDSVILLVNNLGGLPAIELALLVNEALLWCRKKNIIVERVISGSLMSSLNLPGFSFTLLLLPRAPVLPSFDSRLSFDANLIIECFDARSQIPAWPFTSQCRPEVPVVREAAEVKVAPPSAAGPAPVDKKKFLSMIEAAVKKVIEAEPYITECDRIAGDADAGLTLKSGGEGILAALDAGEISSDDTVAAIFTIAQIVSRDMGGTSGGLYAILLSALTKGLLEAAKIQDSKVATAAVWARALELALNSIYQYTLARPPSRTLVDPLAAFIITFASDPTDFEAAFNEARLATEATKSIVATAGRAAYVDQKALANANIPDAGAYGVLVLLEGIKSVL